MNELPLFASQILYDKDPEYPFFADIWSLAPLNEDRPPFLIAEGRFKTYGAAHDWAVMCHKFLEKNQDRLRNKTWLMENLPPDEYAQIEALLHQRPLKPV